MDPILISMIIAAVVISVIVVPLLCIAICVFAYYIYFLRAWKRERDNLRKRRKRRAHRYRAKRDAVIVYGDKERKDSIEPPAKKSRESSMDSSQPSKGPTGGKFKKSFKSISTDISKMPSRGASKKISELTRKARSDKTTESLVEIRKTSSDISEASPRDQSPKVDIGQHVSQAQHADTQISVTGEVCSTSTSSSQSSGLRPSSLWKLSGNKSRKCDVHYTTPSPHSKGGPTNLPSRKSHEQE